MTLSNMDNDENPEKCEHEEWINRTLHSQWICKNHQHGCENSEMQIYDIMDIIEWYPITMDCLQPEEGNRLSHAVCDDSVALMPLIQINRALFSDGGDTATLQDQVEYTFHELQHRFANHGNIGIISSMLVPTHVFQNTE